MLRGSKPKLLLPTNLCRWPDAASDLMVSFFPVAQSIVGFFDLELAALNSLPVPNGFDTRYQQDPFLTSCESLKISIRSLP